MTKKDYELIARTIRETAKREHYEVAGRTFASQLTVAFMADNPRFNPDKFLDACGY